MRDGKVIDLQRRPGEENIGFFDALGVPISKQAIKAGARELKVMRPDLSKGMRYIAAEDVARWMEQDKPNEALTQARTLVDLTGAYRLLAAIAAAQVAVAFNVKEKEKTA